MRTFNDIVTEHLKIATAAIRPDLTPEDVPDWDSMNYLLFIAELEKEYDISFTMDDVLGMKSLGDVMSALCAKGITI